MNTRVPTPVYSTRYSTSHALIIGINKYAHASPLAYAVADAQAVAAVLRDRFAFPAGNVHLLLDSAANRDAILECFLDLAGEGTAPDDRVTVFFAGHGHTTRSRRGEVGFLVPHDGDIQRLSTLIRWDELTRGSDLIQAKHILFLMDACYGGLAITRALKPGSMRFLKDMLLRYARQVLTAGKADEVVADLGGPLPGHSPFTGYLLEALEGKAADADGIMTANGVMAHVYQAVGRDAQSTQTPHYGYIDGDGDMVLGTPAGVEVTNESKDEDLLIAVPAMSIPEGTVTALESAKEYLSDERHRLKLYELVAEHVREVIAATAEDQFSVQSQWSEDEFRDRVARYERRMQQLVSVEALIAHWAPSASEKTISLAVRRLCDRFTIAGGNTGWLALRWYPALLLLYAGGVAAVASDRYDNLATLLLARVSGSAAYSGQTEPVVVAVTSGVSTVTESFKLMPGHDKQYVPRSEYLYKLLQPTLDDILFLGSDYEQAFDRFEVLYALEHAYQKSRNGGNFWGPPGRFAWKYHGRSSSNPFQEVITEAEVKGLAWAPLVSGLFGGSLDSFKETSIEYGKRIAFLAWY